MLSFSLPPWGVPAAKSPVSSSSDLHARLSFPFPQPSLVFSTSFLIPRLTSSTTSSFITPNWFISWTLLISCSKGMLARWKSCCNDVIWDRNTICINIKAKSEAQKKPQIWLFLTSKSLFLPLKSSFHVGFQCNAMYLLLSTDTGLSVTVETDIKRASVLRNILSSKKDA